MYTFLNPSILILTICQLQTMLTILDQFNKKGVAQIQVLAIYREIQLYQLIIINYCCYCGMLLYLFAHEHYFTAICGFILRTQPKVGCMSQYHIQRHGIALQPLRLAQSEYISMKGRLALDILLNCLVAVGKKLSKQRLVLEWNHGHAGSVIHYFIIEALEYRSQPSILSSFLSSCACRPECFC